MRDHTQTHKSRTMGEINKRPLIEEMRLGFLSNGINANETPTWELVLAIRDRFSESPKLYESVEKRRPSTVPPPRASWQHPTKAHSHLPLN